MSRTSLSRTSLSRTSLSRTSLSRTRRLVALAPLALSLVGVLAVPASAASVSGAPVSAAPVSTVTASASPAGAAAPRAPYDLTLHQQAVVLDLIDDVCGDTWCEGDFAFDFRRFSCSPETRSCTLRLRIASWAQEPLEWKWRSREITGFSRYWQMVDTASNGYVSLDRDFYLAVSDVISEIEESVR